MITIFSILLLHTINTNNKYHKDTPFVIKSQPKEPSEICFYSTNKNKCPTNIKQSNMFGPNEYNSPILSISQSTVKIVIVEPIFLSEPLSFSAPVTFLLEGNQLNGKIEVHCNSIIFIQDPTNTEITLYWSVRSKEIANLRTVLRAKSIFIKVTDQVTDIHPYELKFYSGKNTLINLSTNSFQNHIYSITSSKNVYFVVVDRSKFKIKDESKTLLESHCGWIGNDLEYTFLQNFNELLIEGTGEMIDYTDSISQPWYSYRDEIHSVVIRGGVTSIGSYAFSDCRYIANITIHSNITTIGDSSFQNCVFLSLITLPDTVESIGNSTFFNCISLPYIIIPEKLTQIPDYAFYNCSSMMLVSFHDNVTSIGQYSFYNCCQIFELKFSDKIKIIPQFAFYECSSLTTFDHFNNVTNIGDFAFYGCNGFNSITINEKVDFIGAATFSKCENLKFFKIDEKNDNYEFFENSIISKSDNSIISYVPLDDEYFNYSIPEKVTSISRYSFYSIEKLQNVTFHDQITQIGEFAFYNCYSILSVVIPENVTFISDFTFYNCSSIENLQLPKNLASIGSHSFYNCSKIKLDSMPSKLTHIGDYAFYSCLKVSSISFPRSLTHIGDYAFYGCTGFGYFSLDDDFNYLGKCAFSDCTNIMMIDVSDLNEYYYDDEEGIYDKRKSSLIFYSSNSVHSNYQVSPECKRIAKYAFKNSISLETITLSESVVEIEDYAFYNCSNLKSIQFSSNLEAIGKYAFYNCTSITSLILPDLVDYIGEFAFYGCINLVTIKLPKKLGLIKRATFGFCESLETIEISEKVAEIEGQAFINCHRMTSFSVNANNIYFSSKEGVLFWYYEAILYLYPANKPGEIFTVPESTQIIKENAFSGTIWLSSVEFQNPVKLNDYSFYNSSITEIVGKFKSIGEFAFSHCRNLNKIDIDGVNFINKGQFYHCDSLTYINFEWSNVTSIGDWAFGDCKNLETLYLPSRMVTSIGNYSFVGCPKLKTVSDLTFVEFLGECAFCGCESFSEIEPYCDYIGDFAFANSGVKRMLVHADYIGYGAFQMSTIMHVTFYAPNTTIGRFAFYECHNLKSIYILYNITSAPEFSFYGCTSLETISLPETCTFIGKCAFKGCKKLTDVEIFSDLKLIGPQAFDSCKMLYNLTYFGLNQPKFASDSFANCNALNSVIVTNNYTDSFFCGIPIWSNDTVTGENGSVIEIPKRIPIYIEIEDDEIINNTFYFNESNYKIPKENEILIVKLKPEIQEVIIDHEDNKLPNALEIPESLTQLIITSINNESENYINIITLGKNHKIQSDKNVHLGFEDAKGKIEVSSIDQNYIHISKVSLSSSSEPFNLVINDETYIEKVDLNKNNSKFIVENSNKCNCYIDNFVIQQHISAIVSNCILSNFVTFKIGSSLEVDETVIFDDCKITIYVDKEKEKWEKSYIKGKVEGYPRSIIMTKETGKNYLSNKVLKKSQPQKIVIAESKNNFYCNAWKKMVTEDDNLLLNFSYSCSSDVANGQQVFSLYGSDDKNSSNNKKKKKKGKISAELLAVIIVAAASVVIFIIFFIIATRTTKRRVQKTSSDDSIS